MAFKFSSGVLFVGAPGAVALTDADKVAALQSANVNVEAQRAEVREAAEVSAMAVDQVSYDTSVGGDVSFQEWAPHLLEYTCGATHTSAGGFDEWSIGSDPDNVPQLARIEIHGRLTDGRDVILIMPRAKFNGQPMPFGRDQYTTTQLTFGCYPTKSTGTITDKAIVVRQAQA